MLGGVIVRDAARLRVDHELEARKHRLGDVGGVVDVAAGERLLEDLLDPPAVLGVEAVAREKDEAGHESAVRISPDEEANALALAQVEDPEGGLDELVLGDLEELVARVRLDDLGEGLVVVAPRREARALENVLGLAPQHGDLPGVSAVGGVRVEAEEAPLPDRPAGVVEAGHRDVVQVRGPMDGRARVCLRQAEERRLAGLGRDAPRAERGSVGALAEDP